MMHLKQLLKVSLLLFCTAPLMAFPSSQPLHTTPATGDDFIQIEYPEVYELANIILALTEYGINDKWQVRKDFEYYREMREYFEPFRQHPLIDSVNFSAKRWQEYLSFRTDSYAFVLDDNYKLTRVNDFHSFEIETFDKFKDLVEDFARKSKFRIFFKNHEKYYASITEGYRKAYLLPEMKAFLTTEFGDYFANKKYAIVISPFVYAQNLHRDIDSTWTADFSPVAKPLIDGMPVKDPEERSNDIHTLFTEMDHGYVNPTSAKNRVSELFNEQLWDNESGYAGHGDAVFNEYMTWAVFDLFNAIYFPEIADKINLNWHFQNEERGFPFSELFANKLKSLYQSYHGSKKMKDLYPEMLTWAKEVQGTFTKPKLLNNADSISVQKERNLIELRFSEPMVETEDFDLVLYFGQWEQKVVNINKTNQLKWSENGMRLSFEIALPQRSNYSILFNWWGVAKPLVSKKGISLTALSGLEVK